MSPYGARADIKWLEKVVTLKKETFIENFTENFRKY